MYQHYFIILNFSVQMVVNARIENYYFAGTDKLTIKKVTPAVKFEENYSLALAANGKLPTFVIAISDAIGKVFYKGAEKIRKWISSSTTVEHTESLQLDEGIYKCLAGDCELIGFVQEEDPINFEDAVSGNELTRAAGQTVYIQRPPPILHIDPTEMAQILRDKYAERDRLIQQEENARRNK